jgi:transposase
MGMDVAHLPPRSFHQAARLYGENKSDEGDALVIADVSRSRPRLISAVVPEDEDMATLRLLLARRAFVVRRATALYNRTHDALHQLCPPLEVLFSKEKLHGDLNLRMLARYGGPEGFKRAGQSCVSRWASDLKYHKTRGAELASAVFEAMGDFTLRMPGFAVLEEDVRKIATELIATEAEVCALDKRIKDVAAHFLEVACLMSMPGVGIILGSVIFSEIADISAFKDANHLASYAGVTPARETSGASINRTRKAKGATAV